MSGSALESAALDLLDAVIAAGGAYDQGDPGEVLGNLAHDAGVAYKTASLALLYLEREGLVDVERWDAQEARQANKIVKVALSDGRDREEQA